MTLLLELVGGPGGLLTWFGAAVAGSVASYIVHPHNHGRR